MTGTNDLAYFASYSMAERKSFIMLIPGFTNELHWWHLRASPLKYFEFKLMSVFGASLNYPRQA